MKTKMRQPSLNVPLSGFRYLHKAERGRKVVCEIDLGLLKKMNVAGLLDQIISEARLEYIGGKTVGYTSVKGVMEALGA